VPRGPLCGPLRPAFFATPSFHYLPLGLHLRSESKFTYATFEAKSETSLLAQQCAMSARKSNGGMQAKWPLEPLSIVLERWDLCWNKHVHVFRLLSH
jgi:hypothetical protein